MIVEVGGDQMITIQMLNINDQEGSHLTCRFRYENDTVIRNASLKKSKLSCDPWNYTLNGNTSQMNIQLEVLKKGIVVDKSSGF